MSAMGRGEMIRRLDEAAKDIALLQNGPLSPDEQHTIAASLHRLLPIIANSLQDEEDLRAAEAILASKKGDGDETRSQ